MGQDSGFLAGCVAQKIPKNANFPSLSQPFSQQLISSQTALSKLVL
jgi:hypothetical protein